MTYTAAACVGHRPRPSSWTSGCCGPGCWRPGSGGSAYAIVVAFQLLTNGWLTGRLIVTYDPDAIIGSGTVPFLGDGRIAYAPVEDLGFGFALVLATCALWVWWGPRLPRREGPR